MSEERWYFTKEQLDNSPSRRYGIDPDKELSQRQQAANFIQDMGQRLQVTQLCINTAIVYMHRFYVFHSFTHFHRNAIATAALFLAAKVEEQPRKLEHIIRVAQLCLQKTQTNTDRRSEVYLEQAQELVINENILLQTLGFDVAIEHPHTFIVNFCHLINASKDLSQTSYFMASNSLHLTTMCLQYKPAVVACFCIHLVSKWSNWEIPKSKENQPWYWYIDSTVTQELLEQLTNEFLVIYEKCPSRLKKKINSQNLLVNQNVLSGLTFDATDSRKPQTSGQQSSSAQQHQQKQENQNASCSSRSLLPADVKKSLPSNHHQTTFHSPATKSVPSSSTPALNGANSGHDNVLSSNKLSSNVLSVPMNKINSNHASLQPQQQFRELSSSNHVHKISATNSTTRPRIPSVSQPLPGVLKEQPSLKTEQKNVEKKKEPNLINNNHHSKNNYNKKDAVVHPDINAAFVPTSHSEIISNVVKEVAKQNEKQHNNVTIKSEPEEDDKLLIDHNIVGDSAITKPVKSHSIFSPSPVSQRESLKLSPMDDRCAQEISIKTEPTSPEKINKVGSGFSLSSDSELIPIVKKVETVAGYENIFRKNVVSMPVSSSPSNHELATKEKKNNVAVHLPLFVSNIKEEPFVNYEYLKSSAVCTNEYINHDKLETNDCSSHIHKKKKKHKEKDKRHDKEKRHHKEKKRHKEDKHHHRKELSREKDFHKEPGPIKITIPKEKLLEIPVKLKIKINKDQVVAPPIAVGEASSTDFKYKINKDKLKSRKRDRESDPEQSNAKKLTVHA